MNEANLIPELERMGDPLADRTVAELMALHAPGDTRGLVAATQLMRQWTRNGDLVAWQPETPGADPRVVGALQSYLSEGAVLPEWADPARVARAEQIFMEHGPLSCTLLFCTSLPECYALPHLAEVLQIAGQLEAHTEHRIRQTAAMVFPVMMRGGLLNAEGGGVAQVLKVRLIHASIRHLILQGKVAPSGASSPTTAGPPASLHEALMAHGWDADTRGVPCNQVELAYTLLTFSYSFLRGMRRLGQGLSRADEEAYLHAWNVMGHLLGIRRELMVHTMAEAEALFQGIQHHASSHQVAPDPRPALGQALIRTMAQSIRLPVIRHVPVPLTQWLIGNPTARLIGITEHVSWWTRATFRTGLAVTWAIDRFVGLMIPRFSLSRLFTRIVGYHLLTRFLLDQTRPLNLPDHLLGSLKDTVALWGHDPHASPWLNRLERQFTTAGPWQGASAGLSR